MSMHLSKDSSWLTKFTLNGIGPLRMFTLNSSRPKEAKTNKLQVEFQLNFFSISEIECVRSLGQVDELQLLRNIELYR